jgi:hypothetical protein
MCRENELYKVEIKAPGINYTSYPVDEDDIKIIEHIVDKIKRDASKSAEKDESGWKLIQKEPPRWPLVIPVLEFWDSVQGRTFSLRENELSPEEWPKELTHWRFMIGPPLDF